MALSNRMPLQVSPEFKKKLDEIKRKIMLNKGIDPSFREITDQIIKSPLFEEIEKSIIKAGNINFDVKIKFDGRTA